MANRYWVRNAVGNWNSTANWSSSSAATPGGASVPSTGDVAIFSANSLAGNCTVNISPTVQAVNMTGYTGTLTFNSSGNFITVTTTGTNFTGSTTATIVRSGASVEGTNIRATGTNTTARAINTGAVSEANALNFEITTTSTPTYDLSPVSDGIFKNLIINSLTTFNQIKVYGNFTPTRSNASGSSYVFMGISPSVAATAMVVGTTYTITSTGTTDFTSYGAAANTPNTIFIASGAGTGTGTVTPTKFIYQNGANIVYKVRVGDGTSQGSVALGKFTAFGTNGSLEVLSGFFNNNAFPIYLTGAYPGSNFYVAGSPYVNNIKIQRNTSYNYDLFSEINYSNSPFGLNGGVGTTLDLLEARIYYDMRQGGNIQFKENTVIASFTPVFLVGASAYLFINSLNITFLKLDLTSFKSTIYNAFLTFYYNDSLGYQNPTVNIGQLIDTPNTSRVRYITGVQDDCTSIIYNVIIKKLGGGTDYFTGTRFRYVTGSPTGTWYANTTLPGSLTGNALFNAQNFGSNEDFGGNSGIAFNRYPALGDFNEFF